MTSINLRKAHCVNNGLQKAGVSLGANFGSSVKRILSTAFLPC